MLSEVGGMPREPDFVVLPDKLDDFPTTISRHEEWWETVAARGYDYYVVGQPPAGPQAIVGLAERLGADGVFLGGSDRGWKFDTANVIDDYPVHIGSPGLGGNLRYADRIGCASVDTTSIVVHDYYHHLSFLEEQVGLGGV